MDQQEFFVHIYPLEKVHIFARVFIFFVSTINHTPGICRKTRQTHTFCIHFRISECSILDIPKLVLILALSPFLLYRVSPCYTRLSLYATKYKKASGLFQTAQKMLICFLPK